MTVKSAQSWAGTFVTLDATGAVTAATGTPSGTLYVDGAANGATVTITGSNPYKWSCTLPSLTAGQRVDMYITATIATIATAGVVASDQADTVLLSDGVVVNSGTVTTLTNLPAAPTDWLTAAGVKADAVTKIQQGLALEATLTAIKGAGWTTETLAAIDVLIDAIKAKTDQLTFTTANKVDASAAIDPTGIATSAELAALDDKVDAIKVKTDLMNASAITIVPPIVGSTITILRGDTFVADVTDLGSLATYVSLDFTVKRGKAEEDDDAIIRIRKNASGLNDGLLRLNGAAHTTGTDGSITIDDVPTGDITIMLKAGVTDDLVPGSYVYDIQLIEAADVSTLTTGKLVVTSDVTRAIV